MEGSAAAPALTTNNTPTQIDSRLAQWVKIAVYAGMLNFVVFVIGTFIVGGDAMNARQSCAPGNYLWDKSLTNRCHEVSRAIYLYSKAHVYSVFLSWPLVMAGAAYLAYVKRARRRPRDV